jgi:hypothetical protein
VFTSSDITHSFAVGDRYTLTFDLDTAAVDIDSSATVGHFASAISNLSFSLIPSATGSYTGGRLTSTSLYVYTDTYSPVIEGGAWLGISATVTDPHTTGLAFPQDDEEKDVSLIEFALVPFELSTFTLSPEPGQTLQSALGSIDLDLFDQNASGHGVRIMFGEFTDLDVATANIDSITQASIPEPASYVMIATSITLLYAASVRRRRIGF